MAPPHLKASKPRFQPRVVEKKTVTGRVEKQKGHTKMAIPTFATTLTLRPKTDPPTASPADQTMQDAPETAPADRVNGEPHVPDSTSATQDAGAEPEAEDESELVDKPFNLNQAIPKAGLQFRWENKGKRAILGRWNAENIIAEALYSDMKIIHKSNAQGVISPIFHQASRMIQDGCIDQLLARIGEYRDEDSRRIWEWFLGRLWVHSTMKWPHKLTQRRFVHFFSALVEARWLELIRPKQSCGELPGLLAQHISLFLEAAEGNGFPWSNGGEVFSDYEDE